MAKHPDGKEAQRRSSGAEKDEQYSRSVDCGRQKAVSGHEREAIDYEREKHQPQLRRDRARKARTSSPPRHDAEKS